MQVKEWQQVEIIFQQALDLKAEQRAAYLAVACAGHASLLAEVESLIAAIERRQQFMEEPAFQFGLELLHTQLQGSLQGQTLGQYTVLSVLGRGGMGEVYLAEDNRLGRKVALKFLGADLLGDNWAKRQLIKEAQAVAMLDHSNICHVYGIEEEEGHSFIVMQFIEGETLAKLMSDGPLEHSRVADLAQQIVGALAEAHAHGIIHRDIKPRNIMVTPGGQVKVLDFGLAKMIQKKQGLSGIADSTGQLSHTGLVQGTVCYMSPEQLRAEKLDFRSDIFSIGTVLYEMITGRNPFVRESDADIISAILTSDPGSPDCASKGLSSELDSIVCKCLTKNKEERYQSVSELQYDLTNHKYKNPTRLSKIKTWYLGIAVLCLVLVLLLFSMFSAFRPAKVYTLAVLPIYNQTEDSSLDFLEDALSESMIANLSRLPRLKVKTLSAVSRYQNNSNDPLNIGRELNADAVLAWNIVSQSNTNTLRAEFVDVSTSTQLWAQQFDLNSTSSLDVRNNLSERIINSFGLQLRAEDEKVIKERVNEEAFLHYLRGRHYWRFRNQNNIEKAIKQFQAAIDKDPAYARALAGLADCYVLLNTTAYGSMPTKEAMNRARAAAEAALEIDPMLADAHTVLGVIDLKFRWKWQDAENRFKLAINIDPEQASAHYWYSQLLTIKGRLAEARTESERARTIDPLSSSTQLNSCRQYYYERQFDQSATCLEAVLREEPQNIGARHTLGYVYERQGRIDDSINTFQGLPDSNPSVKLVSLAYAYGRAGRKGQALKMLAQVSELSKEIYISPNERAVIYLGLDQREELFVWLNKAHEERFASLIYLTIDPAFDSVRSDPRYIELARRMELL